MSTYIHIPSKIRVTGVTRVTTCGERPNSLAPTPVTRLRVFSYTRCNAVQTCNAKKSPRLLRADVRRTLIQRDSRWLRLQNAGRGIGRYTLPETLGDD